MDDLDWLKDDYSCSCGESINQIRTEKVSRDNNVWLKMVMEFLEKHKKHGFEL